MPNVFSTILEVYNDTLIVRNIRKYKRIVFLAMRLLFAELGIWGKRMLRIKTNYTN